MRKTGLRYRNPHALRHTYASLLLSQGEDIGWVSRQLRHKSIAVTLSIYSHWVRGTRHVGADGLDRQAGKAKEEKA
jgi:integrase